MATDLSQFQSATATVLLATAVIVSLAKPLLEARWLPTASSLHDTVIRLVAIATAVLIIVCATLASLPPHNVLTAGLLFAAVVEGGKAGIGAVVAYHLLSGSFFDQGTTIVQGPAPTPEEPSAVVVPPQSGSTVVVTPAAEPEPPATSPSAAGGTATAPPGG